MESASGLHHNQEHAKSSSSSVLNKKNNSWNKRETSSSINVPNPTINNVSYNTHGQPPAETNIVREQDRYMPIANVIRIMRRVLPPYGKISDDAKEMLQECVSEYISFITSEANERCHSEQRKTITAEDLLWAFGNLGFDNYVEPLAIYLQRYRDNEVERLTQGPDHIAIRSCFESESGPSNVMPPCFAPGIVLAHHGPGIFPPVNLPGFYRTGSGAGSSSSNLANFDPFGHFK